MMMMIIIIIILNIRITFCAVTSNRFSFFLIREHLILIFSFDAKEPFEVSSCHLGVKDFFIEKALFIEKYGKKQSNDLFISDLSQLKENAALLVQIDILTIKYKDR